MESVITTIYTYQIREDLFCDEDGTLVPIYGIEVFSPSSPTPLFSYSDLFTRRHQAEELIALCNRLELDPVHLIDVIEDALTGE